MPNNKKNVPVPPRSEVLPIANDQFDDSELLRKKNLQQRIFFVSVATLLLATCYGFMWFVENHAKQNSFQDISEIGEDAERFGWGNPNLEYYPYKPSANRLDPLSNELSAMEKNFCRGFQKAEGCE